MPGDFNLGDFEDNNQTVSTEDMNNAEKAYYMLKKDIINNKLPLDIPISQTLLAEKYDISRTPLREAVNRLEQENLVVSEKNRRLIIPSLTAEDIDQLVAMRILLETLAVRITIPSFTSEDIQRQEDIMLRFNEAVTSNDSEASIKLHRQFHHGLIKKANIHLKSVINNLQEQSKRYQKIYSANYPFDIESHRDILSTIKEKDSDLVVHKLSAHYSKIALMVLVIIDPSYDPVAIRQVLRNNSVKKTNQ